MKIIVDILFPIFQEIPFSYVADYNEDSLVGKRVIAPVSTQLKSGIIIAERIPEQDSDLNSLRGIHKIIDQNAFINKDLIALINFISEFYVSSLGEVLKFIIPNGTLPRIKKTYELYNKNIFDNIKSVVGKSEIKYQILMILKDEKYQTLRQLEEKTAKTVSNQLNELVKQNVLKQDFKIEKPIINEKYETYLHPIKNKDEVIKQIRANAYNQLEAIEFLSNEKTKAPLSELVRNNFLSNSAIKTLIKKDLIRSEEIEIERQTEINYKMKPENHPMSDEQREIFEKINQDQNQFNCHLLFGITGSGKTLIYINVLQQVIKSNKTAIILIPEIALTPQTAARFRSVFGNLVTFLNSRMSDGERFDAWRYLRDGKYKIVIGPRSAILAPLHNIGLIIVDEEHEWSYKQSDQTPRYNARDLAVYRAKLANCPVILGSATPSLESFHNAINGKYILHKLMKRPSHFKLPDVHVIDLKREIERNPSTENRLISEKLELAIEQRLLKKEQIILFINKRGYSSFVQCNDCGEMQECPHCTITLVYHQKNQKMICHYCSYEEKSKSECNKCSSQSLKLKGFGTQRIEELLNNRFPHANVLRMDMDTTKKKNGHIDILRKFSNHEADILFGTQMITKGLDFENVTLVGVLSADLSLAIPDFRSAERSYQLFSQVAGRAGRGEKSGDVYIQSFLPDHYAIEHARNHDYESFYNEEIINRQPLNYPPHFKLINIRFLSEDESEVMNAARYFSIEFNRLSKFKVSVLGPAPALIYKIKKKFRWNILIKTSKHQKTLKELLNYLMQNTKRKFKHSIVLIDIDPYDLI